ncbi:hypothetical protein HOF65_06340 [bacterium]|nr:hypothetical protein [bacterium]MBT3853547.1 hypothetical protein [bacterium]MBT4633689.1 hypothetical protein [bacterium]MBT6779038.1 hypothetical protein [bacterium]
MYSQLKSYKYDNCCLSSFVLFSFDSSLFFVSRKDSHLNGNKRLLCNCILDESSSSSNNLTHDLKSLASQSMYLSILYELYMSIIA